MFRRFNSLYTPFKIFSHHGRTKKVNVFCNVQNGCSYHAEPQNDQQFLQSSIIPTDHFQASLPRLPIPELEKTCERYLNAQRPLLNDTQMNHVQKLVDSFKSEGKELQEELKSINAKNKHTSYISEPWFSMYLTSRSPLVLNYNPFLSFKDDPKPKYNTQLFRATNMIYSSLRFMKSLKANILEPEVFHLNPDKSDTAFFKKTLRLFPQSFSWHGAYLFKAFPLDMSQFKNLFNSTRIPQKGKDEIQVFPDSRHMAVLRNGHFYVFDVIDKDGNILPPTHLCDLINYILLDVQPVPQHPVSVLTTENRDTWAEARDHLVKLGNGDTLHEIDSAIFVLVLDEVELKDDNVKAAHNLLHGPLHNRWFDKSFSLIISKDAKAAINFEHAWGDGVAVLRLFNEIFKDSTTNHFVGPKTVSANVDAAHSVKKLDFMLDDKIKSTIQTAQENYKKSVSNLQLNVFQHSKLTRDYIKSQKLSPDSVVQFGFQMATYKLFGKFVSTYESCSTSAFKHGRTETVRPLTMPVKQCTEEFHKASRPSSGELIQLLRECTKVHNQLTKDAAMGQGFDRHLFVLRDLAEKKGAKMPALFQDKSYTDINHFVLSTSTLFGPAFMGGGFAPVVKDGFGLAYGFIDNITGCLVSSYAPDRNGAAFADALQKSYDEIYSVLSSS